MPDAAHAPLPSAAAWHAACHVARHASAEACWHIRQPLLPGLLPISWQKPASLRSSGLHPVAACSKAASQPPPDCTAAACTGCLYSFRAVGSIQHPDLLAVLLQTADDKLADSYAALERKAQLYERLKAGEAGYDDEERYNVDFLKKGFLEDDAAPSSGQRLPVVEDRHGSPRRGGELGVQAGSAGS